MASSSLETIRIKIRRLTRSPSQAQLSDTEIDNYINTFLQFDFPEHLRTFNYRTSFSFYTNPGQDIYNTDISYYGTATNNPLYNFQNNYLTVHPPVYIAGYQSVFSQSPEQLYSIYPMTKSIVSIGSVGDGITTSFTGTIVPNQAIIPQNNFYQYITLLQNNVMFSSINSFGLGISLIDSPVVDKSTGYNTQLGILYDPSNPPVSLPIYCTPQGIPLSYMNDPNFAPYLNNWVNYSTGQYSITFTAAPGPMQAINSQASPEYASLPQMLMFYGNQFVVRPIPDQPYEINFEVYKLPTQLLSDSQSPDLFEYWQYIAYGSAKKIFEDRMDLDSVAMILPEYKIQERLCLRRTIVQNTNERTATIYSEQSQSNNSGQWWGNGNF